MEKVYEIKNRIQTKSMEETMRRLIGVVLAVFLCAIFLPFSLRADGGSAIVQMSVSPQQVSPGDSFTLEVKVDSGQDKLGAFQFEIEYDPSVLELDGNVGLNGVEPGDDGFAKNGKLSNDGHCVYVDDQGNKRSEAYCVNVVDGQDGKKILRVNGFDANGVGPGSDLSVIKVRFKVKDTAQPGQTTIKLFTDNSNSESHHPMGILAFIRGDNDVTIVRETIQESIDKTLRITPPLPGDCNGDGVVTIDEVQKAINCFLSDENSCCDKCDLNGDGQVGIDEVQKIINAFLGIQ